MNTKTANDKQQLFFNEIGYCPKCKSGEIILVFDHLEKHFSCRCKTCGFYSTHYDEIEDLIKYLKQIKGDNMPKYDQFGVELSEVLSIDNNKTKGDNMPRDIYIDNDSTINKDDGPAKGQKIEMIKKVSNGYALYAEDGHWDVSEVDPDHEYVFNNIDDMCKFIKEYFR